MICGGVQSGNLTGSDPALRDRGQGRESGIGRLLYLRYCNMVRSKEPIRRSRYGDVCNFRFSRNIGKEPVHEQISFSTFSMLFFCFLCVTVPLSALAGPTPSADELLEKSGIKFQVEQLQTTVRQQIEIMERQMGPLPPGRKATLMEASHKALEPKKLLTELAEGIDGLLEPEHRREIVKFFDSPLGRKVVAADKSLASPEFLEKMENEGAALVEKLMKDHSRLALIQSLDKATIATDLATDTNLACGLALEWALINNSDMPDKPGFEQLQKFYADSRPATKMQMAQMVLAGYAYGYRNLTNEELTNYLAFANSPAGKRHFLGIGKLLAKVLTRAAAETGTFMSESEKGPV